MAEEDEDTSTSKKTPEDREDQRKRIKALSTERSEDTAKLVRTWLQAANDDK